MKELDGGDKGFARELPTEHARETRLRCAHTVIGADVGMANMGHSTSSTKVDAPVKRGQGGVRYDGSMTGRTNVVAAGGGSACAEAEVLAPFSAS